MSEAVNGAGESIGRQTELCHNARKVLERTRRAWMARPEEFLPADASIAVGNGFAALTRGGWVIYEDVDRATTRPITVADAERFAQREPEYEWCIHLVVPGQERYYKRIGPGQWKLYKWGACVGRFPVRLALRLGQTAL